VRVAAAVATTRPAGKQETHPRAAIVQGGMRSFSVGYAVAMTDPERELRLADAAARARVTPAAMRLAIEVGDLAARRDGKRLLVHADDIDEWVRRHGVIADEAPGG
jgi:hypothetical protein